MRYEAYCEAALSIIIVLGLNFIRKIVFPPLNFPKEIPTIPFYVSFLGSYTKLDQRDIFNIYLREKLEEYGAVKIYFASRWNILVTKPSFLVEIFSNEDIYAKSGNHVKIPYSILSDYTGDNLISAHGENWTLYRKTLTAAIQFPNLDPVIHNSKLLLNCIDDKILTMNSLIPVGDLVQRFSLANIGQSLLGINFKLFEENDPEINQRLRFVKSQIFRPFYLNFPFLDKFPIPSRIRARKAVAEFREYFCNLVKTSQQEPSNLKNGAGTVGYKLVEALNNGNFTEKQFRDNAMITMIAGHENPLLLLTSLLYILAKHGDVQKKLRQELQLIKDIEKSPYLNAILYETLRLFPPLGQIINRCTTRNVVLGSFIKIPKGAYVGYNNFATGRDRTVWQENADTFDPTRWGEALLEINRNYSKAKSSATLPAFHGRKRACLGEKFALFETKQALAHILTKYKLKLDDKWIEKLTSGGPVTPINLKLRFKKL